MKQLPITSPSLEYVITSFKEWLDIQGYSESTVKALPVHVRELLHYAETHHAIRQVQQLTPAHFKEHYERLTLRSNLRHGGALSSAYLNKHIQGMLKFADYLRKTGRFELPFIELSLNEPNSKAIDVVSVEEIRALFAACDDHPNIPIYEAIAARDKALLTVYYSCGLRRNEGYHLDLTDIHFDQQLLHVRKGKGYKERFVPFNKAGSAILSRYVYDYRHCFKHSGELNALFVSAKGNRMGYQNTSIRLRTLIHRTDQSALKQKQVSLHTLRHSIATHLLEAGMPLEHISRFLGHSSLESTQIYTHLATTTNH